MTQTETTSPLDQAFAQATGPQGPSRTTGLDRYYNEIQIAEFTARPDVDVEREMMRASLLTSPASGFAAPFAFDFALNFSRGVAGFIPNDAQIRALLRVAAPDEESRQAVDYIPFPDGVRKVTEFAEAGQQIPAGEGVAGFLGDVAGSVAPSAVALAFPPLTAPVLAAFAQRAGLENLEQGGTIASALGAATIEAGTEFIGGIFIPRKVAGRVLSKLGDAVFRRDFASAARIVGGLTTTGSAEGLEEVFTLVGTELTNAAFSDINGTAGSAEAFGAALANIRDQAPGVFAAGFVGGTMLFGPALAQQSIVQPPQVRRVQQPSALVQLSDPGQREALQQAIGEEVDEPRSVDEIIGAAAPEELPAIRQVLEQMAEDESLSQQERQRATDAVETMEEPTTPRAAEQASADLRARLRGSISDARTLIQLGEPVPAVMRDLQREARDTAREEIKKLQDENKAIVKRVRGIARQQIEDKKELAKQIREALPKSLQGRFTARILNANTEQARGKVLQEALEAKAVDDRKNAVKDFNKARQRARKADVVPGIRTALRQLVEPFSEDATTQEIVERTESIKAAVKAGRALRSAELKGRKDLSAALAGEAAAEVDERGRRVKGQRLERSRMPDLLHPLTNMTLSDLLWTLGGKLSRLREVIYTAQDVAKDAADTKYYRWHDALLEGYKSAGWTADRIARASAVLGGRRKARRRPVTINETQLDMTDDERMDLTATLQDASNRALIERGAPILLKGAKGETAVQMTKEEIAEWAAGEHVSGTEMAAIRVALDLLNGEMKEDMRAWSREHLLEERVQEGTYYPRGRTLTRPQELELDKQIALNPFGEQSIESSPLVHERTRDIKKPIAIGSFFARTTDVAWRQAQVTERTRAYQNAKNLLNDPQMRRAFENRKGGRRAAKQLDLWMEEIGREALRSPTPRVDTSTLLRRAARNVSVASLAGNLKVALYQPVSLANAAHVIRPKYLMAAFAQTAPQILGDPINKDIRQTSYLRTRTEGSTSGFVTDTDAGVQDVLDQKGSLVERTKQILMVHIRMMDNLAIRTIWRAAHMQAEEAGETRSGERIALDTVKQTQPTWDVLNTSGVTLQARRSDFLRIITLFRSQRGKNLSLLYRSIATGDDKQIAISLTSLLLGSLLIAQIRIWYDIALGKDDKEQEYRTLLDTVETFFGNFVGGQGIVSVARKALGDTKPFFEPDFSPVLGMVEDVMVGAAGLGTDIRDGDIEDIAKLVSSASSLAGIPAIGPMRQLRDIIKATKDEPESLF